jgi:hypothetical protein
MTMSPRTQASLVMGLGMFLFLGLPAYAHDCHQSWQMSRGEGWHRHSLTCGTQPGLSMSDRAKRRIRGASEGGRVIVAAKRKRAAEAALP